MTMLLHTRNNIGIIPLFLICVIISFLYYNTSQIDFIVPPMTFFLLFTFYIIAFKRFFLDTPSFSNHITSIFLWTVIGFFSFEMTLGLLPAFIVTTIYYHIWNKHPASSPIGGCFMVICGMICGLAGSVQFFGRDILNPNFISVSLPIFCMGLCWTFYIFITPILRNYKIPETLLAPVISMMIFVCAIYIGHLDYMVLSV